MRIHPRFTSDRPIVNYFAHLSWRHGKAHRHTIDTPGIWLSPQLSKTGVAVEKGTTAVILLNLSVFGERTFNNLQTKFLAKVLRKEFFNTHRP
jgi:hypothetical protein